MRKYLSSWSEVLAWRIMSSKTTFNPTFVRLLYFSSAYRFPFIIINIYSKVGAETRDPIGITFYWRFPAGKFFQAGLILLLSYNLSRPNSNVNVDGKLGICINILRRNIEFRYWGVNLFYNWFDLIQYTHSCHWISPQGVFTWWGYTVSTTIATHEPSYSYTESF